jgi:hypothetical protein
LADTAGEPGEIPRAGKPQSSRQTRNDRNLKSFLPPHLRFLLGRNR